MTAPLLSPAQLDAYFDQYCPAALDAATWGEVSGEVLALVRRGGTPTRIRVAVDLTAITGMIAHLMERGRPNTLDEVLSDQALLSYDIAMQRAGVDEGYRTNKRSVLRRLRAVREGAERRAPNRSFDERVDALVSHTLLEDFHRLLTIAQASDDDGAAALILAVETVRRQRVGAPRTGRIQEWRQAQSFALSHGMPLDMVLVRHLVTHEVLQLDLPAAVIATQCRLTPNDLGLAHTRVRDLPAIPDADIRALLRGPAPKPAHVDGGRDCTS